jgi:hypothetical protein
MYFPKPILEAHLSTTRMALRRHLTGASRKHHDADDMPARTPGLPDSRTPGLPESRNPGIPESRTTDDLPAPASRGWWRARASPLTCGGAAVPRKHHDADGACSGALRAAQAKDKAWMNNNMIHSVATALPVTPGEGTASRKRKRPLRQLALNTRLHTSRQTNTGPIYLRVIYSDIGTHYRGTKQHTLDQQPQPT